jgi:hypothetical protein
MLFFTGLPMPDFDDDDKPIKRTISFSIEPDNARALKRLAREDRRTVSQYLSLLVKDYLDDQDSKGKEDDSTD